MKNFLLGSIFVAIFSTFIISAPISKAADSCTNIVMPADAVATAKAYCEGYVGCTGVDATAGCTALVGKTAISNAVLGHATASSGLNTTSSVPAIIGNVIKVILGVSGTVALIFIIWGGIQWMISKGDGGKIGEARKLMTSGMIGIAIIAAAYAITDFVIKQITVIAG